MEIIDFYTGSFARRCIVLLGYFDGVHTGHRALIEHAKKIAASKKDGEAVGIMTFYDGKRDGQIYLFEERVQIFASLGLDFVFAAPFHEEFRSMTAQEFLVRVTKNLNVGAFLCGEDFTFGKDATGNSVTLQEFGKANGIEVFVDKIVAFGGEKAAATQAKRLLRSGDVEQLARLLGERYFICGTVETEGRHIGRKIGFPTANIHPSPEKYPLKQGVYAVTVRGDGWEYRGLANYGSRPTFHDASVVLEVYLDGCSEDLYGKSITVFFDEYIREIKKFESAQQLSLQLKKDLEKIR